MGSARKFLNKCRTFSDMSEAIRTVSVTSGFLKSDWVLLSETPTTAIVFAPEIHPGGIRGRILRFKKNDKAKWEQVNEVDFRGLKPFEGALIELKTEAVAKLIDEVGKRKAILAQQGTPSGPREFVVAEKGSLVIDDKNKIEAIKKILDQGYSNDFWELLSESNPGLADKLVAGHLHESRRKVIKELGERLTKSYPETSGDDSWQSWIYRNSWLFGVNYGKPIEKQKINITGVMPDYIFPRLDGFVDVLEIKLPTEDVIIAVPGHPGAWAWSTATNHAIGQTVNYLAEIDRLRFEIENEIRNKYQQEFSVLKPNGYVLIGSNQGWTKAKKEALRNLNHSLHGIEVLTYTELQERGQAFLGELYSKKQENET